MPESRIKKLTPLRFFALIAGAIGLLAILVLGTNVAREVTRMDRNLAENANFSLSQAEIEFLEFVNVIIPPDTDLDEVRLRFDIFYGRITTIRQARAFARLREDPAFLIDLETISAFLDQSVRLVDLPDPQLRENLDVLRAQADDVRPHVRQMSIIGLDRFARIADIQRQNIARTTGQLGFAVIALIAGLALALLFLDRTNRQAILRGRALELSAARMNTIINTALDGVIVTDENYRIVEFSPAAENIFGLTTSAATGREIFDFVDLITPADADMDRHTAITAILTEPARLKRDAQRADGSRFPAEIAVQRAETSEGDIYIAFVRDISRRVEAEAALVAARDAALANEQIKTDFMATMSHEIRTPLNGLLGNMDLLRDTDLNKTQERYLHNMDTSGRMLMRHVSDVLDITQYDSGKMSITSELTHLPTLMDDIIASQISLAVAQGTSLTWDWDGATADWIKCDPDRVQHILMNLIGNAVKFTKDGSVTVTLSKYDDERQPHVLFQIEDTGPGISDTLIPRIFDDFVTGDATYTRDASGTGLGLSIAKRFATGLGGTVGVESELGTGSTFWFDLPVTLAQDPRSGARHKTLPPIAVQDILLVEDNRINRVVAREMLEADGHRVTEAANGKEGVALAAAQKFDLILMDISMPVLDGREAAREIRLGSGKSAATPIVALTANAMADDKAGFRAAGMVTTLTKPLTRLALRAMLRDVTQAPALPRSPLVDLEHLSEMRVVLSKDRFRATHSAFRKEGDALLQWMQAHPTADLRQIAKRAHDVAGSCSLFGAVELSGALIALENAAREGNDLRVHQYQTILPDIWKGTLLALDDALKDVASSA